MDMSGMNMGSSSPPPPAAQAQSQGTDQMGHHTLSTMVMQMSFYWSNKVTVLFDSWTTSTTGMYIFAVLLTFLFCVLHELATTIRISLFANKIAATGRGSEVEGEAKTLPSNYHPLLSWPGRQRQISLRLHVLFTLLYCWNVASGYIIMLIIMSFNGGLFLAVVLGHTLGFFLFGLARSMSAPQSSELCCAIE